MNQITAVSLAVKDIARLKTFYTAIFKWEIWRENDSIVILKSENILLSLCSEALFFDYTGIKARENNGFYLTINFGSVENVKSQFEELNLKGVDIIKQPENTFWGGYSGFVADPEGNLWELCYNPIN